MKCDLHFSSRNGKGDCYLPFLFFGETVATLGRGHVTNREPDKRCVILLRPTPVPSSNILSFPGCYFHSLLPTKVCLGLMRRTTTLHSLAPHIHPLMRMRTVKYIIYHSLNRIKLLQHDPTFRIEHKNPARVCWSCCGR